MQNSSCYFFVICSCRVLVWFEFEFQMQSHIPGDCFQDIIIRSLCNLLFLVLVISVFCKLNKLGVSHYYFYNVREIFLRFFEERFIRNAFVRYRTKG